MSRVNDETLSQLVDLYQQSRKRGEQVSLSLESKDGNDVVIFKVGKPTATLESRPSYSGTRRRKSPSQMRRDQSRKEEFFAKKARPVCVVKLGESEQVELPEVKDEIDLETMDDTSSNEAPTLFQIKGEYKNPKFRPFETVEPNKDIKVLWEAIDKENRKHEMVEIGDGSTCFEHFFEFWGKWKVKPGTTKNFLMDTKTWPDGVKILDVKPA